MERHDREKTVEKTFAVKSDIGRFILCALVILAEIVVLIVTFSGLNIYITWLERLTHVVALIMVLYIYAAHDISNIKTSYIMLLLIMPIIGVGFLLIMGLNGHTKKMKQRYASIDEWLMPKLTEGGVGEKAGLVSEKLCKEDPLLYSVSEYLSKNSGYPLFKNTDIEYFADQCEALEAMKQAISKAKHFIFMEYHAIEDKEAWHGIEEVLFERARAGVEVRVFYDDLGSIFFINKEFKNKLEANGVKCRVFNPFMPPLNFFLDNRDHRKITVIDGRVGFTGGFNLANEYFNITHPYGQWKDTAVKVSGEAVRSMTITFLENWNATKKGERDEASLTGYLPEIIYEAHEDAYVQPYADSPMDHEYVGQNTYISILNRATDYCWFITPYLIITDEMIYAMTIAAKRGVDVRIITPGIPDKGFVYRTTRSYYNALTSKGVRIYEWTPGFCHSKVCVSDDKVATCGTINLDFRSFFHHFENGCLYMKCKAVLDTRRDFEETFKECREVTQYYTTGRGRFLRFEQLLLKLIAPLL
ncbi:MAG: cardiolipin synthase [Lachnospiraceae bacterium]|nr:cardiolipin synthase [Lachnospiraceae bacterium]